MDKLQYRSDGAAETPSGFFAVIMALQSGAYDGTSWFEYMATPLSDVIRIEWPTPPDDQPHVVILPQETARDLVRAGYAVGLTKNQVDAFNAAVDAENIAEGSITKTDLAPTDPSLLGTSSPTPEITAQGNVSGVELDDNAGEGDKSLPAPVLPGILPVDATANTGNNAGVAGAEVTPVVPVVPKKTR